MTLSAALALALGAAPTSVELAPDEGTTAVRRLAKRAAVAIADHHPEPPVAVAIFGDSPALSHAFATLLSSELARAKLAPVPIDAAGPADAERSARQVGARALVRLGVSLENGELAARGDLLGTWVNFWSGAVPTRPATPAAALALSTPADADALALNVASPIRHTSVPQPLRLSGAVLAHLTEPTAALAMGDLDGDGRAEIIALTDDDVSVFAPNGKLIARRDHHLLPSSPTPCREAFGGLAVLTNPQRVAYYSARRAKGELLALEKGSLKSVGVLERVPLGRVGDVALESQFQPGENLFGPAVSCGEQKRTADPFVTASAHAGAQGPAFFFAMPNGTGSLYFGSLGANPKSVEGVGAGAALADLGGDNHLVLVASAPQFAPVVDELRAYELNGNGLGPLVWRSGELPKGARVLQVAAGDVDGDGVDELVVGLWLEDGTGEIDLFRRVPP